jgi:hypothetical protein
MADTRQPLLSVRDVKVEFSIKDAKAWPWTPATQPQSRGRYLV